MNFIWLRNDLRITENSLIQKANELGEKYFFIYILDKNILAKTPQIRRDFLFKCLEDVNNSLSKFNSELIVIDDDFKKFLSNLSGVKSIITSHDYSSYAYFRDKIVSDLLTTKNINYYKVSNNYFFEQFDIKNKSGTPFQVFTPFKKSLLFELKSYASQKSLIDTSILAQSKEIQEFLCRFNIKTYKLSSINTESGETKAKSIFSKFLQDKISDYHINRNYPYEDNTSKLSSYIKFGCISPFYILSEVLNNVGIQFSNLDELTKYPGHESFISEIIWRDFYKYIFLHFPWTEKLSFKDKFKDIKWENDLKKFESWYKGETGYPIVDAFMRQINKTGWMHNRGRMITGSFLVKDLHIDWKWGEKYFKENLIDFDVASNNGGWQWVAGTGTDSAPYFRIFNPIEQSKKFDSKGKFIKSYVPELSLVPTEFIHEPWKIPVSLQQELKLIIGKDYPSPIVDHDLARKKTLEMYK